MTSRGRKRARTRNANSLSSVNLEESEVVMLGENGTLATGAAAAGGAGAVAPAGAESDENQQTVLHIPDEKVNDDTNLKSTNVDERKGNCNNGTEMIVAVDPVQVDDLPSTGTTNTTNSTNLNTNIILPNGNKRTRRRTPSTGGATLSAQQDSNTSTPLSKFLSPLMEGVSDVDLDDHLSLSATTSANAMHSRPSSRNNATPTPTPLSDADRERYRRKVEQENKKSAALSDQLRSVSAACRQWEQAWKEEREINLRLWERVQQIQRQLRQMSRPLMQRLHAQSMVYDE